MLKKIAVNKSSIPTLVARAALLASLSVVGVASAAEVPLSEEIKAAVSDRTFQGSMTADRFAEYYDADGSIKADGYSGAWSVNDGEMCFQYGSEPATCWEVELNGPAMTLYKDGAVDGNGMLIEGNVYQFK